jgi:hypothetical protein
MIRMVLAGRAGLWAAVVAAAVLVGCTTPGASPASPSASPAPSDAMMEHSPSPSDAMMEHSPSPS